MKNNRLIIITIIAILSVLSMSVYFRGNNKDSKKESFSIDTRISSIENFNKENNVSALGWLRVEGTKIDYPVVYFNLGENEKNIDYLWSTTLTQGVKGNNRIVVYGHNIRNVSSKPSYKDDSLVRFEELMYFVYYDFAEENQFVQLTYDGEDHLYRVYSVSFLNPLRDSGDLTASKEETAEYIEKALKNSIYKYDIDVNSDDNIISLITCTRFFGISSDMTSFRIDAREVRKDEKRVNSRVTKNSNYDIIEEIIGGNDE